MVSAAPPLTRGWSLKHALEGTALAGSPAHAGMVPLDTLEDHAEAGLPRSRGDGPPEIKAKIAAHTAPPLTRGWSPDDRSSNARSDGSPAHAGMVPTPAARAARIHAAPPLTRGWSRPDVNARDRCHGSPAHAGMVPGLFYWAMTSSRLPRSRGDGPRGVAVLRGALKAPPLTRGWSPCCAARVSFSAGSPAHAGMVPSGRSLRSTAKRLPRSRGDGPASSQTFPSAAMAPPLTRGWSHRAPGRGGLRDGSPAHAGMVPSRSPPIARHARLPRAEAGARLVFCLPMWTLVEQTSRAVEGWRMSLGRSEADLGVQCQTLPNAE